MAGGGRSRVARRLRNENQIARMPAVERRMPPVAAPSAVKLTPAAFCQRLLEAVAADCRRSARDRAQHTILLRPFVDMAIEPAEFEAKLRDHQLRTSNIAETAREILALWRVCAS